MVVAVGLTLFALSTVLSWGLYGTRCAEFLFGTKIIKPYQVLFCLFMVVGATMQLQLAWDIADTLNGLMAIPNLVALLLLSPVVFKLVKEYFSDPARELEKRK
ncbi:Amino-acid carrier protein AlsT [bioreactor metagenome]|uniref:Amino-acid carrier protein AlsT n=1 Tax=bioreactor metagenome TaxID=1076179 RepID=A0A645HBE0_9ZZZZ